MERWSTAEEIAAEHDRLAATLNGWYAPHAHGVGLIPSDAAAPAAEHFQVVNVGPSSLPGVVMADVTGYRRGTASFAISRDDLARAVTKLAPAEAFSAHPHPNLWTWRDRYLPVVAADPKARLVAVFVATKHAVDDEAAEITAFRDALARNNAGASH